MERERGRGSERERGGGGVGSTRKGKEETFKSIHAIR